MSRREDTRTPRQRFTALVQAELDLRMQERKWSVSRFIEKSGVPRPTLYEWLKTDSERMPKVESVKRYCARLGVPFQPYAEALGWTEALAEPPPRDPEGFIRRARAMAEHEDTPEDERRDLMARVEAAEALMEDARERERRAEALIRGVFDEKKDAPGQ